MNISTIIAKIYQAYAPKLAQAGIHLDIDIPNPTLKPERPSQIEKITANYLDFCLKHPKKSTITLTISCGKYQVKDENRLLKPDEKAIFDALATTLHAELAVKTRLGYGTTLTLSCVFS